MTSLWPESTLVCHNSYVYPCLVKESKLVLLKISGYLKVIEIIPQKLIVPSSAVRLTGKRPLMALSPTTVVKGPAKRSSRLVAARIASRLPSEVYL